jgi:hypothetical protein
MGRIAAGLASRGEEEDFVNHFGEGACDVVKDVYAATQLYFKQAGVKSLKLYRGVSGNSEYGKAVRAGVEKGSIKIKTRSASSWSSSQKVAHKFAAKGKGTLIAEETPVHEIMYAPTSFAWARTEAEYVRISDTETITLTKDNATFP